MASSTSRRLTSSRRPRKWRLWHFSAVTLLLVGCRSNPQAAPDAGAPSYSRIDVHVHADPELYDVALKMVGAQKVERFINLSGGPPGEQLQHAVALARRHSPNIAICTNVDWELTEQPGFGERMAQDVAAAAGMGAVCLKIPKALGLGVGPPNEPIMPVDDVRMRPVWTKAGQLHMPVFIHVADPKAFFEPLTPRNERYDELKVHPRWSFADPRFPRREVLLIQFENLLRQNPGTTFVGVHFGNDPEDVAATDRRLDTFPNLMIDTLSLIHI